MITSFKNILFRKVHMGLVGSAMFFFWAGFISGMGDSYVGAANPSTPDSLIRPLDLRVESVSSSPFGPQVGSTVDIAATIVLSGDPVYSDAFPPVEHIVVTATDMTYGISLGEQSFDLQLGERKEIHFSYPNIQIDGTHMIEISADSTDNYPDPDGENNTRNRNIIVNPQFTSFLVKFNTNGVVNSTMASGAAFGASFTATHGYDHNIDGLLPPRPPLQSFLEQYFYYPTNSPSEVRRLNRSIIKMDESMTWPLRLDNYHAVGAMNMKWNSADMQNLRQYYRTIELIDGGTVIDMTTTDTYTYNSVDRNPYTKSLTIRVADPF